MTEPVQDLYLDYLIGSVGAVTATGLSAVGADAISHDPITRMLSQPPP
ncbi:MAG: IS701 family transposase, partial [Thioploca sp.]|nr:IS701 family transposase [Thioploca sp.]